MSAEALDRAASPRTPLERCTGDAARFLRETWGRHALVQPAADQAGFTDLLTLDEVDRLLTTTALRTPFFRMVRSDGTIPESAYTRTGRTGSRDVAGIADPARVAALFEDGATIVLQGLHRWSEPVTRFVRDLELDLGHPCQVNAYVTPPGARGLALHSDPHDVLVLQAFGRKSWQIHAAPDEGGRAPIDAEIGPGDTIYMPAGTPHAASAQETVSGHLTVGVHVVAWRDVLSGVWARLAQDDPAAEGSVPARWTGDPGAFGRELGERLERMAEALKDVDPSAEAEARLERFLSNRAQLARGTIAALAEPVTVDDRTVLRRRPGSLCEVRLRGDVVVALLGDRRLEMPHWLEPAMRRIAQTDELVVGDLRTEVPDAGSRAVLARRLIREGLVRAAGGRPADDR